MEVTIREVAREAGVSVATVSRVLNESGPVRESTRQRVVAVARRLRYTPNGAARSLSTRRTSTIGVVLPDLFGEFFSEVIRGIDQAAQRGGYHVLVSGSHDERGELEAAVGLMVGRVDGLLVMSPYLSGEALGRLVPERVPLMLMNTRVEGEGWDWMDIDNHGGAYAVTAHLVRGGHRRIALIRGAAGNHDAEERVRGYREALRDGGAEWEVALELAGDFTEESGYRAAARLLEVEPRPTAVFASNDSMAIGALSGLRERGVAVPGEMAVVGFDDIPIARYVDPPLTTVRVPMSRLGARAAERLLEAIAGGSGQVRGGEVVETELVVRASCGIATGAVRGGGG